jgi:hypothetical protein
MNDAQRTKAGEANSHIWRVLDALQWIEAQGINEKAKTELDDMRQLLKEARARLDAAVKASE